MERTSKFKQAFVNAAAIFDKRQDDFLADVARSAGCRIQNMREPSAFALDFRDKHGHLCSWPEVGYVPDDMKALSVEEITPKMVALFEQYEAVGRISREAPTA